MVAFRGVSFRKLIPAGSAEAYAFAIFCVAVAAVVRWVVGFWFEGIVPFATFFPAVLLAALIGGIGPGIFAAITGGAVGWWAFMTPPMAFFPLKSGQLISLIAYLITCLILVWAAEHYRRLTKRLEDEQKFHDETEKRLHSLAAIVESSDDAIVSKNLDGVVENWNKGAERIFGYFAKEAIGQPITIVIPEDRLHEEHEILTKIRRGERVDHFETVRRRKDGSLIDISLSVSPIKNAQGEIVGASKIARDITQQKRAQEQISTLAHETEHRSKNVLANVQAIVSISQSDTADGLKRTIEGRIRALANVHSLFVETRWRGANLQAIAKSELAPYSQGDERRIQIYGPPLLLFPDVAQAIAMTLHELATNAAKYGALSAADGRIDLEWSLDGASTLNLHWVETGGPAVQKPTRQGFGGRIIKRMIDQLNGKIRFDWHADGLVCQITFDLPP